MDWVVPGAVLAGKYTLELKLGQGGMGAVWRAQHKELRSPVAIKLIDEQIAQNPDALGRFLREAQSAAALRSPHVVQILDFGTDRGVPFIAMELLEGESLATRLERVGRLPPAEVARIITEIARAIGKAHERSIVHRDLKPDNVYLVQNDEAEVTKVLDFGIAKATQGFGVASSSETRTGAILGTPHYMSPEQAEGTKLVDHRTDVWALGVIAYECLVGRRPFDSDALGSLIIAICTRPVPVPSASGFMLPGFDAWFARACARDLSERFQSARELASELRRVVDPVAGRDIPMSEDARAPFVATAVMHNTPYVSVPPTAGGIPTPPPPKKKSAMPLLLGAFGVLAVVAAAAAVLVGQSRTSAAPPAPTNAPSPPAAAAPIEVAPLPQATTTAASPTLSAKPAPSAATAVVTPVSPPSAGAAPPSIKPKTRPRAPTPKADTPPAPPATATSTAGKVNLGI